MRWWKVDVIEERERDMLYRVLHWYITQLSDWFKIVVIIYRALIATSNSMPFLKYLTQRFKINKIYGTVNWYSQSLFMPCPHCMTYLWPAQKNNSDLHTMRGSTGGCDFQEFIVNGNHSLWQTTLFLTHFDKRNIIILDCGTCLFLMHYTVTCECNTTKHLVFHICTAD